VRTTVDDRLRREAARFSLRFACDDCAHFEARSGRLGRCSFGYPAAPRRDALDAPTLELCKSFELG
jgi:hypothetical protein